MRLVTLLLCGSFVFGQSTAPSSDPKAQPPADQKSQNQDFGSGISARGKASASVVILSDTNGVDFGPYLKRVMEEVRENWYRVIPKCAEMMKGKLAIEFAITKDGRIADMRLVATSGSRTLDRAAWGSISASNPFPPLPSEFTGQYLALRFPFHYNPNGSDSDTSVKRCNDPVEFDLARSGTKTKSGIAVSISAPFPGDTDVPLGGSKVVAALVTGTGTKENSVQWSISGLGCSGTSCGEMTKDSYHAPSAMPSSPFVTLTAVSKADPSAKATVTLHIVDSNPSR
jgi:TonB family protein